MRVAMIGTEAGGGGAGRAMRRAALALLARGHDVDIVQLDPKHVTARSIVVELAANHVSDLARDADLRLLQHDYLDARRSALSDTLFSHDMCGYDLSRLDFLDGYDALNVHWTSYFLSIEAIGEIVARGRPVLFTLHDMAHFTGGCHYSAGCQGYRADCSGCVQISPDTLGIAAAAQALKRTLFNRPNVAVAAPSRWLASSAAGSRVFVGRPCHYISNPIETEVFRPLDRQAIRAEFGLAPDDRALLFGAIHGSERRKGVRQLGAAIEALCQDRRAATALEASRIKVLMFGSASSEHLRARLPAVSLGFIDNDATLAKAYNAADALMLPSIEDNQPNVMIEAMACGTPVVAFDIGGAPDWIVNGETGFVAPAFDVGAMAQGAADILFDDALAARMRAAAAAKVHRECNFEIVGAKLEAALQALLDAVGPASASAPPPPRPDEEGRRAASAPLRYSPRLDAIAALLPEPEPEPEPAAAADPDPPTVEEADPVDAAFRRFHEARTELLTRLRAAPDGQLRSAYRVTRTPSQGGIRTGFGAIVLNVLASYAWRWSTLVGAARRLPGYGFAGLRRFERSSNANQDRTA